VNHRVHDVDNMPVESVVLWMSPWNPPVGNCIDIRSVVPT